MAAKHPAWIVNVPSSSLEVKFTFSWDKLSSMFIMSTKVGCVWRWVATRGNFEIES